MKIAFIGTYPPRNCGIGTFTMNLFKSMVRPKIPQQTIEGFIIAMNDHEQEYNYPEEVKLTIRQEHQGDYLEAIKSINMSGADVCILEHEYGIYGGNSGSYILPLLYRLEIPLVVTLHTILKTPSDNEKLVLQQICKLAQKVVVMSHKAIEFLIGIYGVDKDKIALIEHGVPDIHYERKVIKKKLKLERKKLLLTFGMLSRNKGIETVIKALPQVVEKHPEVLYLVLGKTHPNVVRQNGEEYRNYLQRLTKNLQLEDHVIFMNKFVTQNELFKYLSASDIYITPYLNEAQITSGTLSYAVGVGAAVLSTPYWHAAELLADERGRLFDFQDTEGLSSILLDLLDEPEKLKTLQRNARHYGKTITWTKSGDKYVRLVQEVIKQTPTIAVKKKSFIDPLLMPPFSLSHIQRMTDDTGLIQHAKYGIPNLKEGYCLDDNARALLMVLMTYRQKKDKAALDLAPIYLSYIHYMQNDDGTFRNFMSFNRNFLDEVGSEDSFGRTIWALGYLLDNAPNDAYYQSGQFIFSKAAPNFQKLKSIRGIANTMIGISYYLSAKPNDELMRQTLHDMAYKLVTHYEGNSSAQWKWFEQELTYDNGLLPLALLHAAELLNDDKIAKVALESMDFLTHITLKNGYLSVIGNEKWYRKDEERSIYAQQPVDALAMVLMYHQAFHLTKNKKYLTQLFTCFMWFMGENDLKANLFDFETNGCYDGFDSQSVNLNQGAESTLAYLISHLTVLQAFQNIEDNDLKQK